jgi:hypothetical protein
MIFIITNTLDDLVESSPHERQVSVESSFRYARNKNSKVIETSSKSGYNVDLYVKNTIGYSIKYYKQ